MNATKGKILAASLQLFNTHGISNVSLRTIAEGVGISVGNLQYHFKKREAIVEAHYFALVKKIDAIVFLESEDVFKSFFNSADGLIHMLFEYHFFLLDFTAIIRNNSKIKAHYSEVSKQREIAFLDSIQVLIAEGLFRREALHDEYLSVFKRIEVISNFWFSSILIQEDTLHKKAIKDYSSLVSQSLYPYLTDLGKDRYAKLFPNQMVSGSQT